MQNSKAIFTVVAVGALAVLAGSATADNKHRRLEIIRATLVGQGEVPAVSTKASGRFRAVIDEDSQLITYTLTYEGLEGGNTLFAHIHLGERHTNGGVMVFLCGGGTKPDPCPNTTGEVTGSITPADVVAIATQQVPAGAFGELLDALRTPGLAYVNVHTTASPGGEIRGQVF
jgi:CHRD domain